MSRLAQRHALPLFLLLAFLPAWALWLGSGVLSRRTEYPPDGAWLAAQLGVFAPALAAFAVGALARPDRLRTPLLLAPALYLPALLLGAAITSHGFSDLRRVDSPWTVLATILAVAALVLLGRRANRIEPWPLGEAGRGSIAGWSAGAGLLTAAVFAAGWAFGSPSGQDLAAPLFVPYRELTLLAAVLALGWNLVFGGSLGEEPGWRGFLLPRLLRDRTPLGASLVVGFWWALWHAPIDWVQGFVVPGPGGLLARQLWALPIAVLFTWVTVRAGGSLLPAIAFHTVLNAVPDFALVEPARYEASVAVFWVVSLVTAVVVVTVDPRMLHPPSRLDGEELG